VSVDVNSSRAFIVGESLVDVTRTVAGESTIHPGGSPLNVAVGLARLGLPTTLVTQLGDDSRGTLVRDHLARSGVDVVALDPPRRTGSATAWLDEQGRAAYSFDIGWDPVAISVPAGVTRVHVGSIASYLPPGADAVLGCAHRARAAGIPVSFDPNVRPALAPDLSEVRRRVLELVAEAEVVKLSDEDVDALFPDRSPEAVVDDLIATGGPRLVVLTRGGDGATLATGDHRVAVGAMPVPVVDTIGAGDSFMAAVLAVLAEPSMAGSLDRDQLSFLGAVACEAAAITCSRPGADPPWRRELPALAGETASPPTS